MDRWLDSLQKNVFPSPKPHANSGPNVPKEFADLVKVSDDEDVPVVTTKVYDTDPDDASIPDQVAALFERRGFDIPQAAAPLVKRALTKDAPMQLFMRLSKIDEEKRLVFGVATSEAPDRENEVCDYEGSKPYFQKWSESVRKDSGGKSAGNVREMHTLSAVGTLEQIQFNDAAKQIEVCAKVVDDGAWKKVKAGVYSGFSVGGRYAKTWQVGKLTHYIADPVEVSLVDRPCVPNATFQLVKADGTTEICKFTGGSMSKNDEFHKASYAHHDERATSHAKMMGHHGEGSPEHAFHKSGHESHTTMRDFHKCAMEKAAGDELNKVTTEVNEDQIRAVFMKMLGNTLVPSNVSAVTPVARAGQPPITPAAAMERVPLEFRKLVSVEDGQDAPGVA